ncbi:MAG TPA: hypothetical protein VFW40_08645 [Capsulimonadaceae bacterium]|nr:hypothetical protein [Capsulimonadaceae bacterium]
MSQNTFLYIGAEGGDLIRVLDPVSMTLAATITVAGAADFLELLLSPDGAFLYALSNNITSAVIYKIDTSSNTVVGTSSPGVGSLTHYMSMAISPDGATLYAVGTGGIGYDTYATSGMTFGAAWGDRSASNEGILVAISPDGTVLCSCGTLNFVTTRANTLQFYRVSDGDLLGSFTAPIQAGDGRYIYGAVLFSVDGSQVYAVGDRQLSNGNELLIDTVSASTFLLASTTIIQSLFSGNTGHSASLNPAGTDLWVDESNAGTLRDYTVSNFAFNATAAIFTPSSVIDTAILFDGASLYATDGTGIVRKLSTATRAVVATYTDASIELHAIAAAPPAGPPAPPSPPTLNPASASCPPEITLSW